MNTRLFEAEMKLHGDTLETLSKKIGISRQCLCNKKNGQLASFTQPEIYAIRKIYGLSAKKVFDIFFAE